MWDDRHCVVSSSEELNGRIFVQSLWRLVIVQMFIESFVHGSHATSMDKILKRML